MRSCIQYLSVYEHWVHFPPSYAVCADTSPVLTEVESDIGFYNNLFMFHVSVSPRSYNNKKTRVIPHHLQLAIRNDEELNKLLAGVTIAHVSLWDKRASDDPNQSEHHVYLDLDQWRNASSVDEGCNQ